jgi:formylmethanofuran dehydrogenase subunit E
MSGGELQKVCIARPWSRSLRSCSWTSPQAAWTSNQWRSCPWCARWPWGTGRGGHDMHDLSTALRFADRFLFLKKGRCWPCATERASPRRSSPRPTECPFSSKGSGDVRWSSRKTDASRRRSRPMGCTLTKEQLDRAVAFHGHECPGLTIGLRAASCACAISGTTTKPPRGRGGNGHVRGGRHPGPDRLPYGKGNLIHRDLGKMAFSFYRRKDGSASGPFCVRNPTARPASRPGADEEGLFRRATEEKPRCDEMRESTANTCCPSTFPRSSHRRAAAPPPRRGHPGQPACEHCGESTMESRTRRFDGKTLCIPCFEAVEQKR